MLKHIRSRHRFMLRYTGALLKSLRRPVLAYMIILSASLMSLASCAFYFIERGINPRVESLFDAFYFVVGTMTGGGTSDIQPVGHLGKVFAMGFMLLGTAIFVAFTAVLATILIEIELEIENSGKR